MVGTIPTDIVYGIVAQCFGHSPLSSLLAPLPAGRKLAHFVLTLFYHRDLPRFRLTDY